VLYDIARYRGVEYVTLDNPVHAWELEDCAKAQGVEPRPGDAVLIRSGSEQWWRDHANAPAGEGSQTVPGVPERPGVHASALEFLYEHDAAILVWDLQDAGEQGYDQPGGGAIHYIALPYMGMPLLDNALLDPLGEACAQLGRYEFMFVCAPLVVWGGTGSPVNPLAVL
jgi:kynurenine formamidase